MADNQQAPSGAAPKFDFNPDKLRQRFHEITNMVRNTRAKAAPIRQQYETFRRQEMAILEQQRPLVDKLKEMEGPLYDLMNEQAAIARALGGQTGPDPTTMAEAEKANPENATAPAPAQPAAPAPSKT